MSFGIIELILVILKIEYRFSQRQWGGGGGRGGGGGGGGVCSLANYSVAYEETKSNRVSDFRDFVSSLFPKAILFDVYFNHYLFVELET